MKKVILILIAGMLLSGCATPISNEIQKAHIKLGIIRIDMPYMEYKEILGNNLTNWSIVNRTNNKTPRYLWSHNQHSEYFWSDGQYYSYEINSLSYGFESTSDNHLRSYKLTKFFDTHLEAVQYYLNLKPSDQKETIALIKWKAWILKQENLAKKNKSRNVNTTDGKIAYAKGVCESVGYTPGTDDFRDCTIKIMTAPSGQQTVVVGSGNRQQLLRPYPLGCRSMGGNWGC